ncbi:hypothetical protein [Myxococcus sp. SDU36]|uniref:hypothetical protein n=1 Tax=Myxococcus sp. SDU36 TaxID=2831967 RepID=UPI0025431BAD|nr:hypothetical protein [Myxococcus sp. SDU36]WIG94312.1 hypothetical protein KGD87_27740 [Myxococcus sp. SDU36]
MRHARCLLFANLWFAACAATPWMPREAEHYGFANATNRRVWVRGPWEAISPSNDIDVVIDQLCPAIMRLPGATDGDHGQEYCGALYSLGDGIYHASFPSPLGTKRPVGPSRRKTCYAPMSVQDTRGRASVIADYHSHPWSPSPMSEEDRRANTQRYFIRIQFDSRCIIHKLVPHANETRPGELYVREAQRWRLVGRILPEDKATGRITTVTE